VHSFFSANRIPTIDAVYREVQNNEEIPNISRSKLYNVLHELKKILITKLKIQVTTYIVFN
jgi:Fe2+ or Zn2+ uptake regulation protein